MCVLEGMGEYFSKALYKQIRDVPSLILSLIHMYLFYLSLLADLVSTEAVILH